MAEPAPGRRGSRRPLAVIALAAVLGAVAMATAAGLTWWTQPFDDSLTGRIDAAASGAATLPELVPVALVVLAGLGATLATRGVARRLVGLLLVLAGVLVGVRSVLALLDAPAALTGQLVRPATAAAPATGHPFGPLLALVGALAVTVAGVLVLLARDAGGRRALGARYDRHRTAPAAGGVTGATTFDADPSGSDAPTARDGGRGLSVGEPGRRTAGGPAPGLRDAADRNTGPVDAEARTVDWWNQLDAGADPTAGRSVDAAASASAPEADGPPHGATDPRL